MTKNDTHHTYYIDTHAHVYDGMFSGDEESVVEKSREAGVRIIIQPDIDMNERPKMFGLYRQHPDFFRNMVGLYPGSVDMNWEADVADAESHARDSGVVAVGEIGLDYHYSKDTAELQMAALEAQFKMADRLDLPVNIHERDATEDFFKVLDRCRGLRLRGNMHAYSGSYETFLRLQKYGDWLVGIGGVVTFKNAGVAEAVKKIPLDRIVLETDAPYLSPVPFRGQRNDSSRLPLIAEKIASLKDIPLQEVVEMTTENACRLFNISI